MFKCFTDKAFFHRFLKISVPVMLSAFISFLVSFLDNVMVGTVSNDAVSGVYAANQVTYLFNLASFGLLEGAGIFIQQFVGAKDKNHLRQSFCYKILVSVVFMIIVMPIVYLFGSRLIHFYSYKDQNASSILEEGTKYLRIVAISYIPYMMGYSYSSSLRETGNTKYAMYSSLVAILSNTLFNILFIMILKQGARGAAIATIIARILEMLFLIILCSYKKFDFCHNAFKNFKIDGGLFKKITEKGWLLFINEIGYSVGVVLQSLAFSQRDGVLSSISIVSTISNIFGILITGLSTGIGVMVGSSLGAEDFDKAKDENKKLNIMGLYFSLAAGLILVSTSFFLPYLFKEVTIAQKELATKLIIIYASLMWANCLSITSYMTLKVGGKSGQTFMLDTGLMILLYVPLSWILARFTNLSIIYIYLFVRSLDVLKAFVGVFLIKKGDWVRNLTYNHKQKEA